jgi:biotin-(acetyl-CoA carboxylase) ligase
MGVDERGALLLQTATGMQTIHGGEVSMRTVS